MAAVDAGAQLLVELVGQAFAAFEADVQFHVRESEQKCAEDSGSLLNSTAAQKPSTRKQHGEETWTPQKVTKKGWLLHPTPALRSGVPSLRSCSREDRAAGPILGPSA
ncbi:hypothetical protein GCM10011247_08970 [Pseudomonas plecoglossicida]|nr:hypothetical protein GCM10011247_08970 [Pseudomonas plecoglossicida]